MEEVIMAGNTTVIRRKGGSISSEDREKMKQENIRHLLLCAPIAAAVEYADRRDGWNVVRELAARKGTAIVELAREALRYKAIVKALRKRVDAPGFLFAVARRVQGLFWRLVGKERGYGLQRVMVEFLRDAAANEPRDSRMRYVATEFFRSLEKMRKEGEEERFGKSSSK